MSAIRWARVEYQPDLRGAPAAPVPLGVVLVYSHEGIRAVVALGREPAPGTRPKELGDTGTLGRAQLEGWVMAMSKDVLKAEDPFARLLSQWRWNLYVRDPEPIKERVEGDVRRYLLTLAKRLYERHVNEPFQLDLEQPRIPHHRAHPMPWVAQDVEAFATVGE